MRRVLVLGVALSLSPVLLAVGVVSAEGSAVSVSGLAQGARGDAVKAVQQALVNKGIAVAGGVDGIFGSGTAAAVKQFQSGNGLAATGVVDDATALALGLASSPLLGLAPGSRGDSVKQLQQRLLDAGIAVSGGADGIFGSGTRAALEQFQTGKGLAVTGTVDAATAAALGGVTASTPTPESAPAAPAGGSATTATTLKIGAKGDAVKTIQRQLIAAGFPVVGGADGVFGVLTANAVSSFQYSVGLTANAIVDDATSVALADAAAKAGGSGSGGSSGGTADAPGATSPLLGLERGARGDAVKLLQETLIKAGVTVKGGADGVFGVATQTALTQYQSAAGISASGVVDEATASALASGKSVSGASSGLVGLKAGSLGTSVKELQEALIKAGVSVRGGADGIFGPATAQALKTFQSSQGLEATGIVDDATLAALRNPSAAAPGGSSESLGFAVFGEKSTRVISLQGALVKAGITVRGGVDGEFGAGTSAAVMDFQRANGLRVTGRIDDSTAAALGLAKEAAPAAPDAGSVQLQVFPVQGRCYYGDSYGYPRSGGRAHLGVDIIAPEGKLLYAAAGGTITKIYADYPGSLAGNAIRLTMDDGTYFFYAHMTGIADGIAVGARVAAGQVVGTVGKTGNTGTSHLHFEVHPRGGSAVNPYPLVKAIDACNVTEPLPQA